MSLSVGRAKLLTSLKELHMRFDKVHDKWHDEVAKDFANRYVQPLDGKTRAAVSAMEKMYEVVSRARKECESDR